MNTTELPSGPVERIVRLNPMELKMTIADALEFADEWSRGLTLHEDAQGWRVVCMLLAEEVRRLTPGHDRYETARRMNPLQWADAWKLNIATGKPFDEIVDELQPFLRPNTQVQRGA